LILIIGTAGHIDHGKTSLVKALTGIDADRLKEEKARGITIDLGFAYKPLPDGGVLGFVDVPGHEKLVRNMLAGATGIDYVMLVVAADDGPMPQTREHLAIIDLLGLTQGVVVLTKCDLVPAEQLAALGAEMRALLAPTGLAGAEVLAVSNVTGQGIAALEQHLLQARAQPSRARAQGHFRLAVDRCFTLGGIGTVVTGTATAGTVSVGDRVLVTPRGLPVRVRGLHAQNREATQGQAGQRLALNLAATGLEKSDIERGDWIVAEAAHAPTRRLDARLRLLPSETKSLAHWTPVHLHLGACDVGARVALLEGETVAPGASSLVQFELEREIGALRGDRFIVRDQSATRTLGGGIVIDPFAPPSRRRKAGRLAALGAMEKPSAADALAALLELEPAAGVDLDRFFVARNLRPDERQAVLQAVPHRALHVDGPARAFRPGQLERYAEALRATLAAHHQRQPDSPGLTPEQMQRQSSPRPAAAVFTVLLRELVSGGTLRRAGPYLRLAGHEVALLPNEQKLWERLRPWLDEGGVHPPKLTDLLARDRTLHREQLLRLMHKLVRMGRMYAVGAEYFVQPKHLCVLAERAQQLAQEDPHRRLNVKALREATGMSRHLSVPLVEFFDQVGFTKRDPEGRKIRRNARDMFGGHAND
jgi:selenocysteine-specific elongation factor